ncbi:MAG: nucleotidyl transferase AbiEii/AbiGii toxin family protein [Planctomycetota bacterium]
MSSLRDALTQIVAELADHQFALVGGLAVSARVEPRFTRDIDLAVAVTSDTEAEELVAHLRRSGYETVALVEQKATGRLATIRLQASEDAPTVDLLFASSGIESETVAESELLAVLGDEPLPVARIAHLLAMKILADDPVDRPQDRMDAIALIKVATPEEVNRTAELLSLITSRGANRGRDLDQRLRKLRKETGR